MYKNMLSEFKGQGQDVQKCATLACKIMSAENNQGPRLIKTLWPPLPPTKENLDGGPTPGAELLPQVTLHNVNYMCGQGGMWQSLLKFLFDQTFTFSYSCLKS